MDLITHSPSTFTKAEFGNNLNGDNNGPIVLEQTDHDDNFKNIVVDYASQREPQLKRLSIWCNARRDLLR